jgi:threonine aldolase
MNTIDLRSDTVTHPTATMRKAMFEAELGDDVLGDDPTVKRLEKIAAERVGKEAAVYVASGTMANLVSLLAHTQRGDEVIVGSECHDRPRRGAAAGEAARPQQPAHGPRLPGKHAQSLWRRATYGKRDCGGGSRGA